MSRHLSEILEKLERLGELGRFGDIIETIRGAYDVDHVCYYARSLGLDSRHMDDYFVGSLPEVNGQVRQGGRMVAAMSYSAEWMAHYVEANFPETDPVVQESLVRFDPINWSELDWGVANKNGFMEEAAAFGIGNQGYSIPVRGPGGQFAIFNLNKATTEDTWAKILTEHRTDFLLLAHYTHQQVLKLHGQEHQHTVRPLSMRERDAVRLIGEGMSRGRAAEKLGISENTFRVYIDSARHKLGALNIPHAVALAAHRGIIPPV